MPESNVVEIDFGPFYQAIAACPKCGHKWKVKGEAGEYEVACQKCGTATSVTLDPKVRDDSKVIDGFFGPTLSGEAKCLECGHEWHATAEIGDYELHCPKCGTMKGVFIYATQPRRELVWGCQCGCQLFYVMHEGAQCFRCAKIFSYSDLVED